MRNGDRQKEKGRERKRGGEREEREARWGRGFWLSTTSLFFSLSHFIFCLGRTKTLPLTLARFLHSPRRPEPALFSVPQQRRELCFPCTHGLRQ